MRLCNQSRAPTRKCFAKILVSHSTTSELHCVEIFCPLQKHFTKKPYRKPTSRVLGSLEELQALLSRAWINTSLTVAIARDLFSSISEESRCVFKFKQGCSCIQRFWQTASYQKELIYMYSHASCENLLKALDRYQLHFITDKKKKKEKPPPQ